MKKISQEKISTHIQEVPQEKIEQWKSLYEKYKSILKVNSKSVLEIIEFLKRKYVIVEETSEEFKHVVINNIKLNKPFSQKISSDKELKPIVFTIPHEGNAKKLYDTQEEIYSGCKIIVGMEFETGYVFVEGSDELNDEITSFKGLDKYDINNYYLVANYIRCLKKYKLID
ncbi:hypothetical protein BGU69_16205 [Clostridioides difficile]|uniref:hypothetical protein n=1 Tax=Clostridioides difficile TaxID=1496 RepID=UPI000BB1F06D|nr:hypothetical protein [Clostridioides difficile]PBI47629.1 hypothetical protein BGU69_16205 [Clostridioides difficile]